MLLTGFFVAFFAFLAVVAPTAPVNAASYSAQEMVRSSNTVLMPPGGSTSYTIGFKNTGTTTWHTGGSNFVSVYTYQPKYRNSVFKDASWYKDVQPAKVSADVAPGQVGYFTFVLHAPATTGTYHEAFQMAAENLLWIPGGGFTVDIQVSSSATNVTTSSAGASKDGYSAQLVYRSSPTVTMTPGEKTIYTVGFKNTGSKRWDPDVRNFLSIYTWDPKYRTSVFQDDSWYKPDQPATMLRPATTPGNVGYLKFILKAPSTPGTYHESFHLAAEDLLWVPGGAFTVDITVTSNATAGSSAVSSTPSTDGDADNAASSAGSSAAASSSTTQQSANISMGPSAAGYAALKMIASGSQVDVQTGNLATYRVGFKNTGNKAWMQFGNDAVYLKPIDTSAEKFRASSWNGAIAARLTQNVYPGQIGMFDIRLSAPTDGTGQFSPQFALHVGQDSIDGGTVEVPIDVINGTAPSAIGTVNGDPIFAGAGPKGPDIRVGLFHGAAPVVIAATGTYKLMDGSGNVIRDLSGVTTTSLDIPTETYTVTNGSFTWKTRKVVRFSPDQPTTIFQIPSYEHRPAWDPSLNFNQFRGDLEIHYSDATNKSWTIETLPIEDYLRGLAETSNGSPYEYQKALVTAARTYALFVLSIGGKHQSEYFDVGTDAGDQVYKGYASELVRPNVVRAEQDTRGMAVNYQGKLVVTPYFSRSDGRTRSWTEVWGGPASAHPWLVSVPAPYDQGQTLWGHGVGMSASDAVGRARNGATWTQILKYYYTGVDIAKMY